jgi:putative toxin-antitoxin system antitoxin component (TIGR02293 family)
MEHEGQMEHDTVRRKARTESPDVEAYWEAVKAGHAGSYRYVSLLGLRTHDPIRILRAVERGIEFGALERFQRNTQLSTDALADLVSITLRTLHRRKEQGRLEPEESDRLLRVSRVFGKALELFEGDAAAARRWLSTPLKALRGERPLALARTDLGSREVEAVIDRLEQGVLT